ncbi:hypothetical protein CC1G_14333 [Coprinopsis cinerea okayama7|uniref:Uncharacterized protein n=1 Tax=Coprinopsis cinerea (strain Okayama-7 / 130 / ATCC MYA-4618 / FGSC 9003) TaxID=240176 RepID=D6RM68_COPC7|nr:hypothetical protein CC1G_14333 [Coprinopsis cinerea okayama7\|eukprot:XP_002911337.1 hypothetical protein CC1G_14333 [Coprinopsis cinerea okayama7\
MGASAGRSLDLMDDRYLSTTTLLLRILRVPRPRKASETGLSTYNLFHILRLGTSLKSQDSRGETGVQKRGLGKVSS